MRSLALTVRERLASTSTYTVNINCAALLALIGTRRQQHHYEWDVSNGWLTLPRASANVWTDSELENPLEAITCASQ